jgi:rRNA maturation protein Nop10
MPRTFEKPKRPNPVGELWNSFWYPPRETCPRCGGKNIAYYDPFLFSPVRTLQGRRRLKCAQCKFVWRPSSRGRSVLQMINPFKTY